MGFEDCEHPSRSLGALQTRLCDLASTGKLSKVVSQLEEAGDWPEVRQLADLRAPDSDHCWLWLLATPSGQEVRSREFCIAARMRIGADVLDSEATCACCGGVLDKRGLHALRCAPGESTRGHNWVVNTLVGLGSLSDATAVAEPRGLVSSRPSLRPADLLTTAAFGRPAALDVSIVSPDGEGAGTDPCVATERTKLGKYSGILQELQDEGIQYRPLVWTCWGRPSGEAAAAVRTMAAAAARRRGLGDPSVLEARASAFIGVSIWRRAACMVLACIPYAPREVVDAALPLAWHEDSDVEE